uniref:Uncharacterized protein n=1 Tax=Arundo donax TaxID=35708 RepID=A0A0A9H711_ARUDO
MFYSTNNSRFITIHKLKRVYSQQIDHGAAPGLVDMISLVLLAAAADALEAVLAGLVAAETAAQREEAAIKKLNQSNMVHEESNICSCCDYVFLDVCAS